MHQLKTELEIMSGWQGDISKPLVSICCITYNHEKYIEECLNGFLIQETNFPFEILVDDDFSQDNTAAIIREYHTKYPNIIKPNLRTSNVGPMSNFTQNLKRATGEYIAVCEGDDYWTDPNKLQIQITEMKKYSEVDMSFHPAFKVLNNTTNGVIANHAEQNKVYMTSEVILGGGQFCPTDSLVFKTKVIDKLPEWYFTIAPVGDYYLQILGSINAGLLYINKIMSAYRTHPNNWTNNSQISWLSRLNFISKNSQAMYHLDIHLNYKYTNEIKLASKKEALNFCLNQNFPLDKRKEIFKQYLHLFTLCDKFKVYILYRNKNIYNLFKRAKNSFFPSEFR